MRTTMVAILAIAGCNDDGTAPASPSETGLVDATPAPPPPPPPPECTDERLCLFEGTNAFDSGTSQRSVEVLLPADPIGAPVVFVWHCLGCTATELLGWLDMAAMADAGYVVVAPESRRLPFTEWKVDGDPDDNPDVILFDELAERLIEQYAVDTERVYATGFSAGGLFTTYLTMFRSPELAATAPFSGGSPMYAYSTPQTDLPVMVSWGGPTDTYGGFDFNSASEEFTEALLADGHEVVNCEHSLGHWLPPAAPTQVHAFFDDHGGPDAHPWSDEPDRIADGCTLAAR